MLARWSLWFSCLACVFVTSCGNENAAIRVGYIPIAECAQLYVGIEEGYFADEGIELELVSLPGGARILEALGAGGVDLGFSNVVSLILARSAGLDFVAIAGAGVEDSLHAAHALLVRNDAAIRSIDELSGATIALNTRKNIDELLVSEYLNANGVDPISCSFVEVRFPHMEGVLATGEVDAVAAVEPFVTIPVQRGTARILGEYYIGVAPRIEITAYVSSEKWLADNRQAAASFVRALSRATAYCEANEANLRSVLAEYTRLDQSQVDQIRLPAFTDHNDRVLLQQMCNRVHQRGWTPDPVDATNLVHTSLR